MSDGTESEDGLPQIKRASGPSGELIMLFLVALGGSAVSVKFLVYDIASMGDRSCLFATWAILFVLINGVITSFARWRWVKRRISPSAFLGQVKSLCWYASSILLLVGAWTAWSYQSKNLDPMDRTGMIWLAEFVASYFGLLAMGTFVIPLFIRLKLEP